MLSLWPNLFAFQLVAPLLLRLALGGSLFALYFSSWRNARGIVGLLVGIFIFIGLFTQPAALAASLLLLEEGWSNRHSRLAIFPLLTIALSLLVLGPGFLAFDWPL